MQPRTAGGMGLWGAYISGRPGAAALKGPAFYGMIV